MSWFLSFIQTSIHTRIYLTYDNFRIALVLVFIWLSYRIYTFVNFFFWHFFHIFAVIYLLFLVLCNCQLGCVDPFHISYLSSTSRSISVQIAVADAAAGTIFIYKVVLFGFCDLITFSNCRALRFMSTLLFPTLPLLPLGCLLDPGIMNWHVLHVREVSNFSTSASMLLLAFVVVAIFIVIHLSKIRFHPSASILSLPVYKHYSFVYYFC